MELSLLEKEKKTRIKISQKEWRTDKVLQAMIEVFVDKKILKVEKESSRYKYFISDGDLLNIIKERKQ